MPIDRFSREQFEAALPRTGKTNALWQHIGLVSGEHCYVIPVQPGVLIYVRSSVGIDGVAAETAQDSIRCWLAADSTGKPLGSKLNRWISRVNGWEKRMTETLRTLWRVGKKLGKCNRLLECDTEYTEPKRGWMEGLPGAKSGPLVRCNGQMLALKVKKPGEHLGCWFTKCSACGAFGDWILDEMGQPPGPRVDKLVMKGSR